MLPGEKKFLVHSCVFTHFLGAPSGTQLVPAPSTQHPTPNTQASVHWAARLAVAAIHSHIRSHCDTDHSVNGQQPCRGNQCALPAVKAARLGRDQRARPNRALPTPSRSPAARTTQRPRSPEAGPESVCTKRQCARCAAARKRSRRRGHDGWSSSRARSCEDGD